MKVIDSKRCVSESSSPTRRPNPGISLGSGRAARILWTILLVLSITVFLFSPAGAQTTYQPNTDRRSETDYEESVMARPNPQLCLDACLHSAPCRSWTFARNTDGSATCHLGNQKRQPVADPCCTSGTR